MGAIDTAERVFTHDAARAAVGVLQGVASVAPVPLVEDVFRVLGRIQRLVAETRALQERCERLLTRCVELVDEFKQHCEALKGTTMEKPTEMIFKILKAVEEKLSKYAGWSRWKGMWHKNQIEKDVDACEKDMPRPFEHFTAQATIEMILTQYKLLGSPPPDQIAAAAERAEELATQLQAGAARPDAQLEIAGQRVSRAQYNVVYNEVLRYLNDIERTTGVRPPVVYLETGAVAIEPGGAVRRNFYNAEVYVGWYRKRKVAVKCLTNVKSSNAERAKIRWLNELKIWPKMNHPHVQPLLGVTEVAPENRMGLVSYWQENGNIIEYTQDDRERDRLTLLAKAASGVVYLHEVAQVAHADLKASNILITDEGEPVITDFQLAKLLDSVPAAERSTAANSFSRSQASARWTARERLQDPPAPPSFAGDVWSFGMVVLEVATSRRPFDEYHAAEHSIAVAIAQGRTPRVPQPHEWITPAVRELLLECWRDPGERPRMAEVERRLGEAAAGRVVVPRGSMIM